MVLDSNPGIPDSPSDDDVKHPVVTTPINTRSHTLYRFGDRCWPTTELYLDLAAEMSPYFVGPMPVSDFLEEFLPLPDGPDLLQVEPSFKEGMFDSVLASSDEADMYTPFITALNEHLTKYKIYCTSGSEEQAKTDCPFKIKPDCSVFAKGLSTPGTDSSAVELLIEFKRYPERDPFVTELIQPRMSSSGNTTLLPPPSSSDNTRLPPLPNPFMKSSLDGRQTCGQITAYATSHMSAQYRTHVFFVLICNDYARLIRWDRGGAIVTCPIYYNRAPDLVDFFIRFDHSPADVRGHDTTVRVANCEDTKAAVKVVKEFEELEKSRISLLVASVPDPATGETSEYVIAPPSASPWAPVGRWTRTSIGYDIQRMRSIFMKDYWRPALEGVLKEGDVYSRFEKNAVSNVPHCSNSGDIGDDRYHLTRTDHFLNWNSKYAYDLTPRRHYRLILDDIGQPLDSFKCSQDMVRAVCAALIAHKLAHKCGILHRDISPGNILITSDDKFDGGLLIDWDLCKDIESQVDRPSRAARTGTWQFLAADLVVNPKINHTFVHDLESAYYVVFWLSIRFLPNSWTPEKRRLVLDDLFNPSAFFQEGSRNKQNWMIASSGLELNAFQINGNIPLSDLIRTLNRAFRSRHRLLTELEEARGGAAVPRLVADPEAPPTPIVDDGIEALEKKFEDFAAKLNHDSIIHKFYDSLSHLWPSDERAVKQEIANNERELLCTKSKSKSRSRSYIGKDIGREGSSQKRLRME